MLPLEWDWLYTVAIANSIRDKSAEGVRETVEITPIAIVHQSAHFQLSKRNHTKTLILQVKRLKNMSDNPLSQVGSWHHPFLVSLMIPGSRHNDDEASTVLFLVQKVSRFSH